MPTLNKPSAGDTDWTTEINDNWTAIENSLDQTLCQGRLTLTSGTPITTADVTAAGTLYFTPYKGNRIALFDGSAWNIHALTERSLALVVTSGNNYDVFLYNNAGTLTLELSAAWASNTARTDALTTQDGIYVKSGATTRRYLGTIRASAANQAEDSKSKRFLWNYYNRVPRVLSVVDTTDTWTYTTATWRQARATATNQVEIVIGIAEDPVYAEVYGVASTNALGAPKNIAVGVGISSTTVNSARVMGTRLGANSPSSDAVAMVDQVQARYEDYPGIGYYTLVWLEISSVGGTTTWYGDNAITYLQSGLVAKVMG